MTFGHRTQAQERVIVVGCKNNYPPFEFTDKNGAPIGYNVDLIRAIAKETGLKIRIVSAPWADIRRQFDEGSIDVISMFYSKDRAQIAQFAAPHAFLTYSIFVRKGDRRIRTEADLRGRRVLVEGGGLAFKLLPAQGVQPEPVADPQTALKQLSSGDGDAVVVANVAGLYAIRESGIRNVEIAGRIFPEQKRYCFAVHREGANGLLQKLNEGLAVLKYNGVQESIAAEWLGPWEHQGVALRHVLYVALPLAGLLMLALVWSWTLRREVRRRTALLRVELAERWRAEKRILKLNRLYAVVTKVNKAIIRAKSHEMLFDEVCRLIVEYGQFPLAWIGVVDHATHSVRPVAYASPDIRYVDNLQISTLEQLPEGRGPSGTAAREGRHCIISDIKTDPRMEPWRALALERNYRSTAAFPLKLRGDTIAVLALFASEPHFLDDEEETALLDGVAGDISFALDALDRERQRERAENALHNSEERFRTAFEQAATGVALSDTNTTIQTANSTLCEMLGYTQEELVGMAFISPQLTPPEDIGTGKEYARKLLDGDLSRACWEKRYLHKDGHPVWTQVVNAVVRDSAGKPLHFVTQILDITARKRAEAELRQSNWTLQAIVQASPAAIVALDPEGKVTAWNKASEQMFGWLAEEVLGRPHPIVPEDKTDESQRLVATAMRGEVFADMELKRKKKDGAMLDVSLSVAPLRNAEDQITGVLALYVDLTERKRLEAQLLQSQKLESVGRLAGGVAHDFNNLLTVINCYSDLLLDRLNHQGPLAESLKEIHKAGEQAASLTRQLLAFSRRQVLQLKVVSLDEVVENLKEMLQRLIGEDIELVVLSKPKLGKVKADPGQLQQVIMNLVVNARDAMPRGGKLIIQVEDVELGEEYADAHSDVGPGRYVMLAISDTGAGMDEDTQRRIFEPFFTTKEAGKGTGLGLSMVWGIVKQSGGHIWVYSELGKGTTFKIYLPRVEAPVVPQRLPEKVAISQGNETILLVEDQLQLRELTSRILQGYGYKVLQAANGEQALMICKRENAIHLVLTDIVMPGITGVELGKRLREYLPAVKLVYMSGYTDDVIFRQGALEPTAAYLEKPFTPEGLAAKIREVLGEPAAGQMTA